MFFGGDLFAEPFEGEGVVGDVGLEVLGDLVAVDDLADADADVILSAEGAPFALGGRLDGFEKSFGGAEEFVALTAALGGEAGVAADDEALAGEVVGGDLGEIPLVEEGGVHGPVGEEFLDGGGAEGGDPAQPLDAGEVLADAGGGEHAAIAHQDDAGEAEAGAELLHLGGDGPGVAGRALEDLDGDGAALGEQSSPKTIWSLFFFPSRE